MRSYMFTEFDKRMKTYERVTDTKLTNRMPVIIRVDGIAHHTFTRKFLKPYDPVYSYCMQQTMKYLCEHIHGCVLGYTQSDEITLVLIDYKNLNTCPWFDNRVQKICSATASMATFIFNKILNELCIDMNPYFFNEDEEIEYFIKEYGFNHIETLKSFKTSGDWRDNIEIYREACERGACFDARCFNIPKEDVTNNIFWRQQDAIRNSILMIGQANFSQKEMQNKTCNQVVKMLNEHKGIVWDELPTIQKRGCCCVKRPVTGEQYIRNKWVIDTEIPKFVKDGRKYIDELILI